MSKTSECLEYVIIDQIDLVTLNENQLNIEKIYIFVIFLIYIMEQEFNNYKVSKIKDVQYCEVPGESFTEPSFFDS